MASELFRENRQEIDNGTLDLRYEAKEFLEHEGLSAYDILESLGKHFVQDYDDISDPVLKEQQMNADAVRIIERNLNNIIDQMLSTEDPAKPMYAKTHDDKVVVSSIDPPRASPNTANTGLFDGPPIGQSAKMNNSCKCAGCGGDVGCQDARCPNCGHAIDQNFRANKTSPDKPGKQFNPISAPPTIVNNQQLRASGKGYFVLGSKKKLSKPDKQIQGHEFKMLRSDPESKNDDINSIEQSCDDLAMDG